MAAPSQTGYIAAMAIHRTGFDPSRMQRLRRRRFRRIPVRILVPNVVTLLALCAGLTAIRLAFENRYALALAAIVFAAILDAIDGRLARFLKGTSRFGARMRTGMRRKRRRRCGRSSKGRGLNTIARI